MAWSVLLQSGSGGTQGVNEWEMVYNAVSQDELKAHLNLSLGDSEAEVLYHTPDNGSPIPVRANGRNRLIIVEYEITDQSGWDDVFNIMSPIARLVDGPDSQAVRYWTEGGVDKVRIGIQPDGATYMTYFDVLEGFIDASVAYTSPAGKLNTKAQNAVIALTCAPLGYGDTFTLDNYLASSPHFLEDSNSDGLADGWTKAGTPTTSISSGRYISGGKSQQVQTTTLDHGLRSPTVNVADSTAMVAYAWVFVATGSAFIYIRNTSDSTTLATKTLTTTDSNSVSDKTALDNLGSTWYRVPVSGTNSTGGAKNYEIRVTAATATSNIFVGPCYFESGTLTAPPAFSSANALFNSYEPSITTTHINSYDLWGIPGDAPAIVKLQSDYTESIDDSFMVFGGIEDGELFAANVPYVFEETAFTKQAGTGTWATGQTSSDSHADEYGKYTEAGTPSGVTLRLAMTNNQSLAMRNGTYRIFAHIGSDGTATVTGAAVQLCSLYAKTLTVATSGALKLYDFGLIQFSTILETELSALQTIFTISVSGLAAGELFLLDALFFVPVNSVFVIADYPNGTDSVYVDGQLKRIYTENGVESGAVQLLASPGDTMTRYRLLHYYGDGGTYDITDQFTVSAVIVPQTRHLLGTK